VEVVVVGLDFASRRRLFVVGLEFASRGGCDCKERSWGLLWSWVL